MNFLAHIYLSGDDEQLLVGNFLGDFVTNKEMAALPLSIQQGVRLHRHIDSFTDQHPVVKMSVQRLRAFHGKYAPVILDVLHDFLLAHNWRLYAEQPLPTFTSHAYQILSNHIKWMPAIVQKRLPLMIADDWLTRYGTEEGLRFTFDRMKLRSSFPQQFDNAVESFRLDFDAYNAEFNLFFPDVIESVGKWVQGK